MIEGKSALHRSRKASPVHTHPVTIIIIIFIIVQHVSSFLCATERHLQFIIVMLACVLAAITAFTAAASAAVVTAAVYAYIA